MIKTVINDYDEKLSLFGELLFYSDDGDDGDGERLSLFRVLFQHIGKFDLVIKLYRVDELIIIVKMNTELI